VNKIALTQGRVAIVSAEDFDWLSQWKWCVRMKAWPYPIRSAVMADGRRFRISMHRAIMTPPDGFLVDHINGDPLDNRRENLRVCTQQQNMWNCQSKLPASGYRGVYASGKRWQSKIRHEGGWVTIGVGDDPAVLARKYDDWVRVNRIANLPLNFPTLETQS